jgi:hypothetical protein
MGWRRVCALTAQVVSMGCSPSSPVQEDTALPGTAVQDCQQSEPVESPGGARLGLPLVGVGGAGPCGGAVSPAHPGAGVGAVRRSPRQTCPLF